MPRTNQELLTRQHRDLESSLARIADGAGVAEELANSLELLRLHIYAEEALLFPALKPDPHPWMPMALTRMCEEHGEMWRFIESAARLVAAGANAVDLAPVAQELRHLLHVHDLKEEESIYPAAKLYQPGPNRPPLEQLFATRELPAGWKCRFARS